jgi:hypothetical protein
MSLFRVCTSWKFHLFEWEIESMAQRLQKHRIIFQAPEQDGGSPINKYVVEYRPANRSTWTKAGTVDGDTYEYGSKITET